MSDGSETRGRTASTTRRTLITVVAVLMVIALGTMAILGYRAVTQKRDATSAVDAAMSAIEDADRLVAEVDVALSSKVGSETVTQAAKATSDAETARARLVDAVDDIRAVIPRLSDAERRRAELLSEAAEARIDMMSEAPAILAVSGKAGAALPKAEAAWAGVIRADRLSERAVADYNKLTRAGVRSSARYNRHAGESLAAARAAFLQAESAFPQSELEVYISYVDARIALNRLSRRSDSAWLAGDIAKANSFIATYNAQDKRVVAQGKTLPSSPSNVIATAYDEVTRTRFDAYYAARERATAADATLRSM